MVSRADTQEKQDADRQWGAAVGGSGSRRISGCWSCLFFQGKNAVSVSRGESEVISLVLKLSLSYLEGESILGGRIYLP